MKFEKLKLDPEGLKRVIDYVAGPQNIADFSILGGNNQNRPVFGIESVVGPTDDAYFTVTLTEIHGQISPTDVYLDDTTRKQHYARFFDLVADACGLRSEQR